MKIRSSLCLVILTSLAFGIFYASRKVRGAQQNTKYRNIARLPIERNEPIRIRVVKVKGAKVFNRQKFLAGDDWLGGLTVTIKNRSEKAIVFAAIDLQFPRPLGSEGRIAIDEVEYGNRALLTRRARTDERLSRIAPGQSVDLALPPLQVNAIGFLLTATGYPASIETLNLRVGHVIFEDDTMWYGGSYRQRDPTDSTIWVNEEQSAKNHSSERGRVRSVMGSTRSNGLSKDGLAGRWNLSTSFEELAGTKALFSPVAYITKAPTACFDLGPTAYPGCGTYRWCGGECRIVKDTLTTDPGNYYLLPASGRCRAIDCVTGVNQDCTTTQDTVAANACTGVGGGGGGGGPVGFDNSEQSCTSDWDCDFGYHCDVGTETCQQ